MPCSAKQRSIYNPQQNQLPHLLDRVAWFGTLATQLITTTVTKYISLTPWHVMFSKWIFSHKRPPSSISYRLPKQTAADMLHSLNITKHASTQCLNFGYSIMNVVTEVAELLSWAIQKDTLASALIVAPNAITPPALRAAPNTVPPSEGSFILNPIKYHPFVSGNLFTPHWQGRDNEHSFWKNNC